MKKKIKKPDWLSPEAAAKWDEVAETLDETGMLTEADSDILAQYCSAFADWQKCERLAQELQPVTTLSSKSGVKSISQNPVYLMAQKYSLLTAKLGELLGLNPVSRMKK